MQIGDTEFPVPRFFPRPPKSS